MCSVPKAHNVIAYLGQRLLTLRFCLGLEARHIVSRWREPPEYRKYSEAGLKGDTVASVSALQASDS